MIPLCEILKKAKQCGEKGKLGGFLGPKQGLDYKGAGGEFWRDSMF